MVGADPELFERARPLIATFATEITLCPGSGQVVKNLVLFETVVALSEARAIARRSGVDPQVLLETFTRGSADSFALRNHGVKASPRRISRESLPRRLRARTCAMRWPWLNRPAGSAGRSQRGRWFALALAQGHGSRYFPVISRVIDPDSGSTGQPPHLPHESNRYSRLPQTAASPPSNGRWRSSASPSAPSPSRWPTCHAPRATTRAPCAGSPRWNARVVRRADGRYAPTRITWAAPEATYRLTETILPLLQALGTRARKARPSMPTTTPSHGSACCGSIRIIPP